MNLQEEYELYVRAKLGSSVRIPPLFYIPSAFDAAQRLSEDYDIGVELATDGLALGFFFHLQGLPTKAVKLGRRGRGATWRPLDSLGDSDLRDKRVIVFDNDAITGRTLKRAAVEIGRYVPRCMNLLLVREYTILNVGLYKAWRRSFNLPSLTALIESNFPRLNVRGCRETSEGIEADYVKGDSRFSYEETLRLKNEDLLGLSTRWNVPSEFGKVMTLQKDFEVSEGV